MSLILNVLSAAPDLHVSVNAHADAGSVIFAGNEGINEVVQNQSDEVLTTVRYLAILIAVVFVFYKAIKSQFAVGTILVSGLLAGFFIWLVFNVGLLRDWFGNDLGEESSGNVRPEGAGIVQLYQPPNHDLVL